MINATFGGTERQFEVRPDSVPIMELVMGRSLYAVLKDFTAGHWTFDDVATVVSFAIHGAPRDTRLAYQLAVQGAKFGMPTPRALPYSPHPDVVATLKAEGHGNFAEVAASVLTAAIFGDNAGGVDGTP